MDNGGGGGCQRRNGGSGRRRHETFLTAVFLTQQLFSPLADVSSGEEISCPLLQQYALQGSCRSKVAPMLFFAQDALARQERSWILNPIAGEGVLIVPLRK